MAKLKNYLPGFDANFFSCDWEFIVFIWVVGTKDFHLTSSFLTLFLHIFYYKLDRSKCLVIKRVVQHISYFYAFIEIHMAASFLFSWPERSALYLAMSITYSLTHSLTETEILKSYWHNCCNLRTMHRRNKSQKTRSHKNQILRWPCFLTIWPMMNH